MIVTVTELPLPAPVFATFIRRVNRFVALVEIAGVQERAHVPNTGRMAELLVPGASVVLHEASKCGRKTRFDVTLVRYRSEWVCVDSRMANRLIESVPRSEDRGQPAHGELAIAIQPLVNGADRVRREAPFGEHRFDFEITKGDRRVPVEIKSVNLVENGVALFPDAPTERGTRHLQFLESWVRSGGEAHVVFVVQRSDATHFRPNTSRDPSFAKALSNCLEAGVGVMALRCDVSPERIAVTRKLPLIAS